MGQQGEILHDKPDLLIAEMRQFFVRQCSNIHAIQLIASRIKCIQAADDIHQRCFSRARSSHDRHRLPRSDGQRNVIQRQKRKGVDRVSLTQMLYVDHKDLLYRSITLCLRSMENGRITDTTAVSATKSKTYHTL